MGSRGFNTTERLKGTSSGFYISVQILDPGFISQLIGGTWDGEPYLVDFGGVQASILGLRLAVLKCLSLVEATSRPISPLWL